MTEYVQLNVTGVDHEACHRKFVRAACLGVLSICFLVTLCELGLGDSSTVFHLRDHLSETALGKPGHAKLFQASPVSTGLRFCPRLPSATMWPVRGVRGALHTARAAAEVEDSDAALVTPPGLARRSAIMGATTAAMASFLPESRADNVKVVEAYKGQISEASQEIVESVRQAEIDTALSENREPELSSTSSPRALSLAKHLKSIGATMYGTYWCDQCWEQKKALGKEGMSMIEYVECAPGTQTSNNKLCELKNIPAYPSWEINGQLYRGRYGVEKLEIISNAPAWKS